MKRLAYADPPYPGVAHRYPEKTEVDHQELITRLATDFDGWALSTKSNALRDLLPLCPAGVRVAAWVKPYANAYPSVRPVYAWEPVLFVPARRRSEITFDWHSSVKMGASILGQKPTAFCFWMFALLGAQPNDEFTDLFPGSGAVGVAWEAYGRQMRLFAEAADA
jgi:hypothetical protein